MKIIFNKKEAAAHGDPDDPNNTPEKLVERRKAKLEKLGKFMGADKIEYKMPHKREEYIITRGNEKLTLVARGNGMDGGWIEVH